MSSDAREHLTPAAREPSPLRPRTAMRAIAAAAVAAAMTASLPAGAQELPKRKSGLWEMNMGPGLVMTQCVDQALDDAFRQVGLGMEKEMKCSRSKVERGGGMLSFDSTCNMGGTKVTSRTTVAGDFDKAYKLEMHSKYDPPLMGQAQASTTIEARWVGACKPGQRAGDITMPGGMTINANDMLKRK